MKIGSLMVNPSVLAEARILTDSDSGKTYFLNATGGFTVTLPVPRAGINFEFIIKTSPTTGDYSIRTNANAEIIFGKVITSNVKNASDSSSDIVGSKRVIFSFTDSKVGDSMEFISDGTYWYVVGYCSSYEAIRMESSSVSPSASSSISPSTSPSVSPSTSPSVSPSISPSSS
jgi:hypothetical protein